MTVFKTFNLVSNNPATFATGGLNLVHAHGAPVATAILHLAAIVLTMLATKEKKGDWCFASWKNQVTVQNKGTKED